MELLQCLILNSTYWIHEWTEAGMFDNNRDGAISSYYTVRTSIYLLSLLVKYLGELVQIALLKHAFNCAIFVPTLLADFKSFVKYVYIDHTSFLTNFLIQLLFYWLQKNTVYQMSIKKFSFGICIFLLAVQLKIAIQLKCALRLTVAFWYDDNSRRH